MTQEIRLISALASRRRTRRSCGWIVILLALILIVWASLNDAKAVGLEKIGDCNILWTAAISGPDPTGFKLYWGKNPGGRGKNFDAGTAMQTTCLQAGVTDGQWYLVVRAYNGVGESEDSNEFPFVLQLNPPDAPVVDIQ